MGIGVSIFLLAVGAILAFAVDAEVSGLELETVGFILMGVGIIGLLLSLFIIDSWRARPGYARGDVVREERVIRDDRM